MAEKMSADQKRWRAESDAETMARYDEIMNDAARRNAAIKVARTRADELTRSANAMKRVASGSATKAVKQSPKKK